MPTAPRTAGIPSTGLSAGTYIRHSVGVGYVDKTEPEDTFCDSSTEGSCSFLYIQLLPLAPGLSLISSAHP